MLARIVVSQSMVHCSTGLRLFALSSTRDAAPSSFSPRFQLSGDSSLFFASFRLPVYLDSLFDSLCTRLIVFCLASWGCGSGL